MELKQISERVYYLPASEETDRPVLGYIKGDKFSLMVDAGNSAKHVEIYHNELNKRGLPVPDYVAITHWHWDHTFGMCAVKGIVIAGSTTNRQLKVVKNWEWSEQAMEMRLKTGEEIAFCDHSIRMEYPDRSRIIVRTADIEFDSNLTIDLGGIHCVLSNIGGPHSEDSVSVYIPEEKVLFIGDADCGDCYYNNGEYNKDKLHKLITYLEGTDFIYYIHGHDEPRIKEEVLEYLKGELDKII